MLSIKTNRSNMKKTTLERLSYVKPECRVYSMGEEQFICTSVLPKVPGSTEDGWNNDEGVDGGEFDI